MKRFDVVRSKFFTAEFGDAKIRGSCKLKAPLGNHLVFLFLGHVKIGEPLDANAALESLGWVFPTTVAGFDEGIAQAFNGTVKEKS